MFSKSRLFCAAVAVCLAAGAQASTLPGHFSSLVILGDSLSDLGKANLGAIAAGGTPPAPPPYFNGQFSNGPVWADIVDDAFPMLPLPSIPAGTNPFNFAVGGAKALTDGDASPDLSAQLGILDTVVNSPAAPFLGPRALGVVFLGGNDIGFAAGGAALAAGAAFATATTPAEIAAIQAQAFAAANAGAEAAADRIRASVVELGALGISDVVLVNSTDIGGTPRFRSLGGFAALLATSATEAFNTRLGQVFTLRELSDPSGVRLVNSVSLFDFAGLTASILADPAAAGFTDVTNACLSPLGVCSDPDSFAFWDPFHPTAAAHKLIAEGFVASVGNDALSPIPLPAGVWSLLAGVAGLSLVRARRSSRAV